MTAKRLKRPRDPVQLGKLVGDILTGQVEDRAPTLPECSDAPMTWGSCWLTGTPAYPAHPSVLAVLAGAMLRAMKAANYFSLGQVSPAFNAVNRHAVRRLRSLAASIQAVR